MAPYGGLTHSLPLLGKIFQWFMNDHLKVEGFLFRLHQKVTAFLVLVGLLFITIENFLDSRSIVCKDNGNAYSRQFCWMHGYSYIEPHLQGKSLHDRKSPIFNLSAAGKATGCYVDQTALKTAADAPVTNYYLWLPYMLGLLLVITKLPHILWKKFFETNLLRHIIGGEESWPEIFIGPKNNGGGDGNNDGGKGKGGGGGGGGGDNNKNNGGQGDGGGKKKNKGGGGGGGGKRFKVVKNTDIALNFVRNLKKYNHYHLKYAFWETFNIVAILASIQITDWILNAQFWSYGLEVIHYLNVYQNRSERIQDPMCQVFPTEVSCRIIHGSFSGPEDEQVRSTKHLTKINLISLEPPLYPGQQSLQPEVLLCSLGVVDGHAGRFLSRDHLPSSEASLAVVLQDVATEESARAPAERNHHVQRRMFRPGTGPGQPQQHPGIHRLSPLRGGREHEGGEL